MKLPDFVLRFLGREVATKLDLKENSQMDKSKPWWQSKTIISAAIAAVIGVYNAVGGVKGLPPIPDWIFSVLAGIGIYSRVTATTTISSS